MTLFSKVISAIKKGDSFNLGSNCYGTWNKDGSVEFNSHNEEFFTFASMRDFEQVQFNNKDAEDFTHLYQIAIGHRDDDGNVIIEKAYEHYPISTDDDGGDVLSETIIRGNNTHRMTGEDFRAFVKNKNKSLIGFKGSYREILAQFQEQYCYKFNHDIARSSQIMPFVNGVKIKYIKCLGEYPTRVFNQNYIGHIFTLLDKNGPHMMSENTGYNNPDSQYIFEVIQDENNK
jgi:hypothetical protein